MQSGISVWRNIKFKQEKLLRAYYTCSVCRILAKLYWKKYSLLEYNIVWTNKKNWQWLEISIIHLSTNLLMELVITEGAMKMELVLQQLSTMEIQFSLN